MSYKQRPACTYSCRQFTFSTALSFVTTADLSTLNSPWIVKTEQPIRVLLSLALPMPSTVVTAIPSIEQSGARQPLMELCLYKKVNTTISASFFIPYRMTFLPLSKYDTITVHAPHPPSPQPSLEPVRRTMKKISKITVHVVAQL